MLLSSLIYDINYKLYYKYINSATIPFSFFFFIIINLDYLFMCHHLNTQCLQSLSCLSVCSYNIHNYKHKDLEFNNSLHILNDFKFYENGFNISKLYQILHYIKSYPTFPIQSFTMKALILEFHGDYVLFKSESYNLITI